MRSLEKRIAALEAKAADNTVRYVWRNAGETKADALKRAGYSPEDIVTGNVFIVSWRDAEL